MYTTLEKNSLSEVEGGKADRRMSQVSQPSFFYKRTNHTHSRSALAPRSLFRVGKIVIIYVNTD